MNTALISVGILFLTTAWGVEPNAELAPETTASAERAPSSFDVNAPAILLTVEGMNQHKQLATLKDHLSRVLPLGSTYFEHELAKRRVVLKILTPAPVPELSQKLEGIPLSESSKLGVIDTDEGDLKITARVQ